MYNYFLPKIPLKSVIVIANQPKGKKRQIKQCSKEVVLGMGGGVFSTYMDGWHRAGFPLSLNQSSHARLAGDSAVFNGLVFFSRTLICSVQAVLGDIAVLMVCVIW